MKSVNRTPGSVSLLAAPPGLDLLPSASTEVPKRSWADIVKSQKCDNDKELTSQKCMEQSLQSMDTDSETQANSSTVESDISDSESSVGDSPSVQPAAEPLKLDLSNAIGYMEDLTATAYNDINARRMRIDAPVFVPMSMIAATTTIAPPPGLRTSLRSQAKAFVPGAW
jgi:hypothetical protein